MNLTYIKWDLIESTAKYSTVFIAAVYIKMTCIIETLNYSRNLEKPSVYFYLFISSLFKANLHLS